MMKRHHLNNIFIFNNIYIQNITKIFSHIILINFWLISKISNNVNSYEMIPTTTIIKCDKIILNECDHHQFISDNFCYFDMERYCFKHFYTKCRMQAYVCHYERDLILYENKFCDLVQFLCNEDISDYHWPPEHFEQQIAAMYKRKYSKQSQQQQSQQPLQSMQYHQRNPQYFKLNSTSYLLPIIMNSKQIKKNLI